MTTSVLLENELIKDDSTIPSMVSVIIPNYNHAKYVGDAIQSVSDQDYSNLEIIVVDDGSTDNTREVVCHFDDPRIKYIWQQNAGLSAARNKGIRNARGEYIGLLDADDLYEPDFISTFLRYLNSNPSVDAAYCISQFVDENNNVLFQQTSWTEPPEQLHTRLLNGNFIVPLCMFARKYCYEEVGLFDTSLQGCADWDMWLRFSQRYRVLGINEPLARYRVVMNSMSSDPIHMHEERMSVLQKHIGPEPSSESTSSSIVHKAYGRVYFKTAIEYFQRGELDKLACYLKKAVSVCPSLLGELDTFYELGVGDQPKGRRGHFASLDLARSERMVEQLLFQLLAEVTAARPYRRAAYAQFHYALGLLYYGARQPERARRHLLRSLSYWPQRLSEQQWWSTLLKSLLPSRWMEALRSTLAKRPRIL